MLNLIFNVLGDQLPLFLLVGALWGITNPLMNRESSDMDKKSSVNQNDGISARPGQRSLASYFSLRSMWDGIRYLLFNAKFVAVLVCNQLGSVIYLAALAKSDISLAVPICNAITMVFTTLASSYFNGEKLSAQSALGMTLVVAGISICVAS